MNPQAETLRKFAGVLQGSKETIIELKQKVASAETELAEARQELRIEKMAHELIKRGSVSEDTSFEDVKDYLRKSASEYTESGIPRIDVIAETLNSEPTIPEGSKLASYLREGSENISQSSSTNVVGNSSFEQYLLGNI